MNLTRTDELKEKGVKLRDVYVCIGQALLSSQLWQVDRFQPNSASQAAPLVATEGALHGTQRGPSQGAQQSDPQEAQQGTSQRTTSRSSVRKPDNRNPTLSIIFSKSPIAPVS